MRTRLRPLDGSFLRVETPNAHMHVGWNAVFEAHPDRPRPDVESLRETILSRLHLAPRFRQRLAFPPPGFGEPFWVDDAGFDISRHVLELATGEEPVSLASFRALADAALSVPLDRKRPLWQVLLVPRLEDGRVGMVAKLHHAMADGLAAVDFAVLLFDSTPDPVHAPPGEEWRPRPEPGRLELAVEAAASSAGGMLRVARGAAEFALSPRRQATKVAETLTRMASVVREDMLTAAPASSVNVPIGPQRTLVCHRASMAEIRRAGRRPRLAVAVANGDHITVNDVYLAAVAGALRTLALRRGDAPQPLKVMVPVNLRDESEHGADGGNRIAFSFIELPLHVATAEARLRRIHEATAAFKRSHRPDGSHAMLTALGWLPDPFKGLAARFAASPRAYNVTISNIPGPQAPLYMLGAMLHEAYPVVPISEEHALSVGVFGYLDHAHFGFYADPRALPEVEHLPEAISAEIRALAGPPPRRRRAAVAPALEDAPAEVTPLR
ncbi:MAG TPA: wax ester/triacylglycerol synthase family O-acyltransferase [Thermoleophilaceae bacterium]|nr:wax ester/triacylglycerol synthase family O-acyltransferase [Thermoleophilaceae bacterium]